MAVAWVKPAQAQVEEAAERRRGLAETAPEPTAVLASPHTNPAHSVRRQWIVSVEWVTHAPLDVGIELLVETPVGLRLLGGYGWVPAPFSALIRQVAAAQSDDAQAQAVLEHTSYRGRTFWLQLGIKPLRFFGLYADAGYTRATVDGGLVLASSGVAALENLPGSYGVHAVIDMWRVEIGIQNEFADRVIVALALGLMGTMDSQTRIVPAGGAPTSPALDEAAARADGALKSYGKIPSLTLRLGVDLI